MRTWSGNQLSSGDAAVAPSSPGFATPKRFCFNATPAAGSFLRRTGRHLVRPSPQWFMVNQEDIALEKKPLMPWAVSQSYSLSRMFFYLSIVIYIIAGECFVTLIPLLDSLFFGYDIGHQQPAAYTMTIFNVTPSSNLQSINAGAKAGDTIAFAAGVYNVSTTINLQSGVSYLGQPGATLHSASQSNIMQGISVSNITIGGITFDGGPNVVDGAHGAIFLVDDNNVSITNNTFQNMQNDAAVLFYQGDNIKFDSNTAINLREFASGIDSSGAHSNISISSNNLSKIGRIGVEIADN